MELKTRREVDIARYGFIVAEGHRNCLKDRPDCNVIARAAERLPYPKVTRPRVVSTSDGALEYRLVDGQLEYRYPNNVKDNWRRLSAEETENYRRLAALFNNPTEEMEVE